MSIGKKKNSERNKVRVFRGLLFAIPISIVLWVFIVFFFWVFLSGCGSFSSICRQEGFICFQKGFESFPASPFLHEVISLPHVTVHIVGHRKYMRWPGAVSAGSRILGYATSENDIYVFGRKINGKIIVNQAILGHELNHLLSFKNFDIADPDKLESLGF